MTANIELIKSLGISEYNHNRINLIHRQLTDMIEMSPNIPTLDRGYLYERCRDLEYDLQRLWGFTEDSRYHTWCDRLTRRLREHDYTGVTFQCAVTGTKRTVELIDITLNEYVLFSVGKGFVDFGGYNVRLVGVEQVK